MTTHDRYDNDILKQLKRVANGIEKLNKTLEAISGVYDTKEYAYEHPEFVGKINSMCEKEG